MLSETARLAVVAAGTAVVTGLALIGAVAWLLARLGKRRMSRPHAPRVRFLAPPELTLIELRGP